jgi:branched-chain amino acid transport system substrate-binding protein
MFRTRPLVVAAAATAASLILAACGSSGSKTTASSATTKQTAAANSTPLKIGVELPLSGPLGTSSANYAPLVSKLTSEPGNAVIDGHPVQVIMVDDGGTATGAASAARQLIDQDKVDIFLGPLYTNLAEAVLPLTHASKMLDIAFTGCPSCGDGTKYPYVFSIEFNRPVQGPATVNRLKALGLNKMGMIQSNDVTGKNYADAIQTAASQGGVTVSPIVTFPPASLDITAQATQLKNSGVTAVYVASAVPADVINIVKAMKEISYQPYLLGNAALGASTVAQSINDPAWAKKFQSAGFGIGTLRPNLSAKAKQFQSQMHQTLGQNPIKIDLNGAAVIQDAFDMVKAAVQATHATDGPTLAQWLQTNGHDGIRAKYQFTATEHNGLGPQTVGWSVPGTNVDGYSDAAAAVSGS